MNKKQKIEKQQKQSQNKIQIKNKQSGDFKNYHIISQWSDITPQNIQKSKEYFKIQDSIKREKHSQQQSTEYINIDSNNQSNQNIKDQQKNIHTFGLPSPKQAQQQAQDNQIKKLTQFSFEQNKSEQNHIIIDPTQSPKLQFRIQQKQSPQMVISNNSFEISPQIKHKGQFLRMQKSPIKKSQKPKIIKKAPFINDNLGSLSLSHDSINQDVKQVLNLDLKKEDFLEQKQMQKSSSGKQIITHINGRLLSQETYQRKELNSHILSIRKNRENKIPNEDIEQTLNQGKSNDDYNSFSKNNSSKKINQHHLSNISGSVNTNNRNIRKVLTIVTNQQKQKLNDRNYISQNNDGKLQSEDNSESIAPRENALQSINSRSGAKFKDFEDEQVQKQSFDTIKIGADHGIIRSDEQSFDIHHKIRWDSQQEIFAQGSIYDNINQNGLNSPAKSNKKQIGLKYINLGVPSDNQSLSSFSVLHNHEKTYIDNTIQNDTAGQNIQNMKQIHLDIRQIKEQNRASKLSKKKIISDLLSDKKDSIKRGEQNIYQQDEGCNMKDSLIDYNENNEDTQYRRTEALSRVGIKTYNKESKFASKNSIIMPVIKNQIIYSPSIPLFKGSQVHVNYSNDKMNSDINDQMNQQENQSILKMNDQNNNEKINRQKVHQTEITYQVNQIKSYHIQLPKQIKIVADQLQSRFNKNNIFVKGQQDPYNQNMYKIELQQKQIQSYLKESKQKKVSIELNIENMQQKEEKKVNKNMQLQTTQFISKEQLPTQNGELTTVFLSRNVSNNLQNSNSQPFKIEQYRELSYKSLNKTNFQEMQENKQYNKYSEGKIQSARMIASETNLTVNKFVEDQTLEHSPSVPQQNFKMLQLQDKIFKDNSPFQKTNKNQKSTHNSILNSEEDILDKVIKNDPSILQIKNGVQIRPNEQSFQNMNNLTTQYHQKIYSLGSVRSYSSQESQIQEYKTQTMNIEENENINNKNQKKIKVSQLELARKKIEQMQKDNNFFNNNHPKPVTTNYAINELISGKKNPNQNICRMTKDQILQIQQFKKKSQLEEFENRKKEFIRLKNIIESKRSKSQLQQYSQNNQLIKQDEAIQNEEKDRLNISKQKSLKKIKDYQKIFNKIQKDKELQQIEDENKIIQALILKQTLLIESNLENQNNGIYGQFPDIQFNYRKSSIDYIDTQIQDLIKNQHLLKKRNQSISKTVDDRMNSKFKFQRLNNQALSNIKNNEEIGNINNLQINMKINNDLNSDYQTINLNSPNIYSPNRPIQNDNQQANKLKENKDIETAINLSDYQIKNELNATNNLFQNRDQDQKTSQVQDGISIQNHFTKTSKLIDQNKTKESILSPWVIGTKLTPINASLSYSFMGSEGKEKMQQQNKQSSTQHVIRNIFINKQKKVQKENKTLLVLNNNDFLKKQKSNVDKEILDIHNQIIQEQKNRTIQISNLSKIEKNDENNILPEIISKITKQQSQSKNGNHFKSKSTFSKQNRIYQTIDVQQESEQHIIEQPADGTQIEQKTPNLDNIKNSLFQKKNSPKNKVKSQNSDLLDLEKEQVKIEKKSQNMIKQNKLQKQIRKTRVIKREGNNQNKKDECEQINITSKRSSIQLFSKKDNSSFLQSPIENLHPTFILQDPQLFNDDNIIIKKRSSLPVIHSHSNQQTVDSNIFKTNQDIIHQKDDLYFKQQTKKLNNQLNLQKIEQLMNQVQQEEFNDLNDKIARRNSDLQSMQSINNTAIQDNNLKYQNKRNSIKSIESNISSQQYQSNSKNDNQNPMLQILKFENKRSRQNIIENNNQAQYIEKVRNKEKQIELFKQNLEVLKELGLIKNEQIVKQIEDKILSDLNINNRMQDYEQQQQKKRNRNISKTEMTNYDNNKIMQQSKLSRHTSLIQKILTANNSSNEIITPIQKHLIKKQLILKNNPSERDFNNFNFKNVQTPSTYLQSPINELNIKHIYN